MLTSPHGNEVPQNSPTIVYREKPIEIQIAAAITYFGDVQIELIQALTKRENVFSEVGPQIHHLAVQTNFFQEQRAKYIEKGIPPIMECVSTSGVHFSYLDARKLCGIVI